MAQRLAGQTVIMTGGGRGFGENMALAVAAEGADVIVAARDVDEAERVSTDISAAGGNALALGTDVSVEAEVEAMVNAAIERFGKVDVLVNNAGYAWPIAQLPDISLEAWEDLFAVNVRSCFLCNRAVLPGMIERRSGHIVHISSGVCRPGIRRFSALIYVPTKYAVEGLSYGLSVHLAPHNVRVNTIRPNIADTHFFEGIDRSILKGMRAWKPDLNVAPLLHLLAESDKTGQALDAANWHENHGTREAHSYIHD